MRANDIVAVQLIGLPVDVYARAEQVQEGLMREFALIALAEDSGSSVPARLIELTDELQRRYGPFGEAAREQREAAVARGNPQVDLVYHVPRHAGESARALDALLEEADQFCRSGDLLSLAPHGDVLAFRRWFLREFVAQTRGHAPTPWPDYRPATEPNE